MMAIEGAIVTIDAIGCQRDIAQQIVDQKADYVLALRGNQGSLRQDVELFVAEQKASAFTDTKISCDHTVDGDHGRIETRATTVIHDVTWLQERHDWPGLKAVIVVESSREFGDKIERETASTLPRWSYSPTAWGRSSAVTGRSRTACIGCAP
jgi:predicted transposase YbfD/YdcC